MKKRDFQCSNKQPRGCRIEKFSWPVGPNHGGASFDTKNVQPPKSKHFTTSLLYIVTISYIFLYEEFMNRKFIGGARDMRQMRQRESPSETNILRSFFQFWPPHPKSLSGGPEFLLKELMNIFINKNTIWYLFFSLRLCVKKQDLCDLFWNYCIKS